MTCGNTIKNLESVSRETYGKGARWIGWSGWLKRQPILEHVLRKVRDGADVGNKKSMYFKVGLDGTSNTDQMIFVQTDGMGGLSRIAIPCYEAKSMLYLSTESAQYIPDITNWMDADKWEVQLGCLFEDPGLPTKEELEMFGMVYTDPQILITINQKFLSTVLKFNKAVARGDIKIHYNEGDFPW